MSSNVAQAEKDREAEFSAFVYSPAPGWAGKRVKAATSVAAAANTANRMGEVRAAATGAARGEEESAARQKQARDQGFREGYSQAQTAAEGEIRVLRDGVAEALREFRAERDNYFHHVESEVVALALAIVRKILRREAQTDPLLLSGLVRVALEKMAGGQNVRMKVHPAQIRVWNEYFSQQGELEAKPELSGDATLEQNQCQIETEMGVTDLSLDNQLKEIEQGLLDLLAQRPAPR
jgi:flagellar assembly protein FliH